MSEKASKFERSRKVCVASMHGCAGGGGTVF